MPDAIAELNHQFGVPGIAEVVAGNGGLPTVRVTSPAVAGEIYLHGAHVTSWKPAGADEVLFVSAQSKWDSRHAIRGGVPVCFPWFGGKADDPKAPAHGFVRSKAWQIESITQAEGYVTVSMFTESDDETKRWWPADFRAVLRARFGRELHLEFEVTNTGKTPAQFEEALHTYHRIGNIDSLRIQGLDGVSYLDKTDSHQQKTQQGDIVFNSETDRVYLGTSGPLDMQDPVLHRRTRATKENSQSTVIWNPWIKKAQSMSDFGDDEWKGMVCIETTNVGKFAVSIEPGQQHSMKAIVSIVEL